MSDPADDPYSGREQTQAKHFLLKSYLQALAFKILRFSDLTYVDGFSGPWKTQTEDFTDSSFKIAISALVDAQQKIFEQTKKRPTVRCFLCENDPEAFAKLDEAVKPYHNPDKGFEIQTYCGDFETAVDRIKAFVGNSFALIFIDPTGWTGYGFETIKSLFAPRKSEVIINFMYGHVSRFIDKDDPGNEKSLNPILGGPGWKSRLDALLPRGAALLKLFRETLKAVGSFTYVVATKIDKPTEDRPHFFMAYGTKDYVGLKTFRDNEYKALRSHAGNRARAKTRKLENRSGQGGLFGEFEAELKMDSVDDEVKAEMESASPPLLEILRKGPTKFTVLSGFAMENYKLRETNVKDLLVDLAGEGKIENTWGDGRSKPGEETIIRLKR